VTLGDFLGDLDLSALQDRLAGATDADVARAMQRPVVAEADIPVLFSRAADSQLECLASRSRALTRRRFGKVVTLYAPIYVSNECVNSCRYCGFGHDLRVPRSTLSAQRVWEEASLLRAKGFRHILLVSGESRQHAGVDYLAEVVRGLRESFDAISIEIYPLDEAEYRVLERAGVDGVTMYQETYDQDRYRACHPAGPKRNFEYRLEALDRAGRAGFRSLGIGALLGLADWRMDATLLVLHGRYLSRRHWQSRLAVSFPRLREAAAGYRCEYPVADRDLVHMVCAARVALPDAELVMSTREPAGFRDRLIPLGITRMSAGSSTTPGGYANPAATGEQFAVEDSRSPAEVARAIAAHGYEPVWKDADRHLASWNSRN